MTSKIIDLLFNYTRGSYVVLPRLALNELPEDLQKRFVGVLEEAYLHLGATTPTDYVVFRRSTQGQLRSNDPWKNYRDSTVEEAVTEDRLAKLTNNS